MQKSNILFSSKQILMATTHESKAILQVSAIQRQRFNQRYIKIIKATYSTQVNQIKSKPKIKTSQRREKIVLNKREKHDS